MSGATDAITPQVGCADAMPQHLLMRRCRQYAAFIVCLCHAAMYAHAAPMPSFSLMLIDAVDGAMREPR